MAETFRHIWLGGMLEAPEGDGTQRQEYFNDYINAYLLRDVVEDSGVFSTDKFLRFLRASADMTGKRRSTTRRSLGTVVSTSLPRKNGRGNCRQ